MLRRFLKLFRANPRAVAPRRTTPLCLERLETRDLLSAVVPFKLFGTGLNDYGHPLTDGAADAHYSIVSGPSTVAPVVMPQGGFPYPYWTADDSNSAWITPGDAVSNPTNAGNGYQEPEGDYDYRTTFDLTGFDPTTASITGQIGADNTVTQVLLNGQDVGYLPTNVGNNFASLNALNITGGFAGGVNTLDFLVHNDPGNTYNPTGFRADLSGTAQLAGTSIPVFGTGVDDNGNLLADGAVDPHYYIISAPPPYSGIGTVPDAAADAYVTEQNGFPYPYWVADGPDSKWLSPNANENDYEGGVTEPTGDFTYRMTFDLTGFDPTTAHIAGGFSADDSLTQVLLNGQDVGYTPDPAGGSDYTSMHALNLTGGFVAGVNTLDFVVHNINQAAHNPSAFRAQIAGVANPAPGPSLKITTNPNINISQMAGSQAEESIAINPTDPNHLFVSAVDDATTTDLFAATLDRSGGNTAWVPRIIADGEPAFAIGATPAGSGDSLPRAEADPSVAYDQYGNLFLTYLTPGQAPGETPVTQVGLVTSLAAINAPNTLTDANHTWATDEWAGCQLQITGGTGSGPTVYTIAGNTAHQLTIVGTWAAGGGNPDVGSKYIILLPQRRIVLADSTDNGKTFQFFGWVALGAAGADEATVDRPTVTTGPGTTLQAAGNNGIYGPSTLTDPTQNWTVNQWAGEEVAITTGVGAGQFRKIVGNTTNTLTLDSPWDVTPDAESQYVIRTSAASVWVAWDFRNPNPPTGTGQTQVAVRGAAVDGLGVFGSLQAREVVPGSSGGLFADPKVGPTGQLLVTYQTDIGATTAGLADINVGLDDDGLGPHGIINPHPGAPVAQTHVGNGYKILAQPIRKITANATLAWDLSGLHHPGSDGRVYLVYTDVNPRPDPSSTTGGLLYPNDTFIAVEYSNDSGKTWSPYEQVNDRDPNSQFMPAAAVDPTTGWLAVSWYDARNDPGNVQSEIYAAVSDGVLQGAGTAADPFQPRFSMPNAQIAPQPSNAAAGDNFGFGDYAGLAFYNKTFFPAWADNSHSTKTGGVDDNPGPLNGAAPSGAMDVYTAEVDVTMVQPQAPANTPPAPAGGAEPAASLDAQPIASSGLTAAGGPPDAAPQPDGPPSQSAGSQPVIVPAPLDSVAFVPNGEMDLIGGPIGSGFAAAWPSDMTPPPPVAGARPPSLTTPQDPSQPEGQSASTSAASAPATGASTLAAKETSPGQDPPTDPLLAADPADPEGTDVVPIA